MFAVLAGRIVSFELGAEAANTTIAIVGVVEFKLQHIIGDKEAILVSNQEIA